MGVVTEMADRGYAAFNRGDLDTAVKDFSRDLEWIDPLLSEPIRGVDAARAFLESVRPTRPSAGRRSG